MGYMADLTPYHCPTSICSAASYIMAKAMGDYETIWCIVSCSCKHVHVRKLADLREITNLYWPIEEQ